MSTKPEQCGYIYVKNWETFQHYGDRRPIWIKNYVALLDDDEYLALDASSRALLHGLWMLVARTSNGRLVASRSRIATLLGLRRCNLEPLIHAGFIEICASKAASNRASKAASPEEKRVKNPPTPLTGGNGSRENRTNPRALVEDLERAERRAKQLAICRRMWREGLDNGEPRSHLHEALSREFPHDPTIVTETEPPIKETA